MKGKRGGREGKKEGWLMGDMKFGVKREGTGGADGEINFRA